MLQEYLELNKNILIAFVVSIIISAKIAEILSDQPDYLNTTYTTIADYVIYFSVIAGLFFLNNRKNYDVRSGKRDTKKLKSDLKKLFTLWELLKLYILLFDGFYNSISCKLGLMHLLHQLSLKEYLQLFTWQ